MEGYQFAHLEIYSAKGKSTTGPENHAGKRKNGQRAWTAQQIIDELERLEHASKHVISGRPGPEIIPGDVDNFHDLRDAQIASASVKESFPYTKKDGTKGVRNRKLRADAASIYASVVSLPVRTEDALVDDALKTRAVTLLHDAIGHERRRIEKAGGRFMLGVIHWDEEHLHVHIIALDPERGRVKHLHPGHAAKDKVIEETARRKIPKKEVNKLGNRAYCGAMRAWQDDFHQVVFKDAGLLRFGPRRERLSRDQYKRAKASAKMRLEADQLVENLAAETAAAEKTKKAAEDIIERSEAREASVRAKADALEFGTAAVLERKIKYRAKTAEKPEHLVFGPTAPKAKEERRGIARRIQPAFDLIIGFARRFADLDARQKDLARREDMLGKKQKRLKQAEARLKAREEQLDLTAAHLGWRSRLLKRVTRSLHDFVPRQLHHVIAAVERDEDPLMSRGPEAFPDAWSIPETADRAKIQRRLDEMQNADITRTFAASQDAYLLCEAEPKLQTTFGRGLRVLAYEANLRGLDLETGHHDPANATKKSRARLHTDTPPEPIRVHRVVRDRQLVR